MRGKARSASPRNPLRSLSGEPISSPRRSSWRVRVALALYGVPYEYVAVNLLDGEQQQMSQMAQVPLHERLH